MKILITSSRTWDDIELIQNTLYAHVGTLRPKDIWLIHGDCPKGGDRIAHNIALLNRWNIHRFPADWETYGKRAGYVRNAEMVKTGGADICLAFIRDGSKGATMCADLAEKAGIPVERIYK